MSTESTRKREYYLQNKERILEKQKVYVARNRERIKELRRDYYQKNKAKWRDNYHSKHSGMTEDVVEKLRRLQDNACAICSAEFEDRSKVMADHCHNTNTPRGLLCRRCNLIEGQVRKTGISYEEFCTKMLHYLSDPPASKL